MWGVSLTHPMMTVFRWGVSLTHPMLASFLSGEFLLHIPFWLYLLYFWFFFLSWEFLLHIPCWFHIYLGSFSDTSRAGFVFFCLFFYVGSFCYTFRNYYFFKYFFNGVVSLTHPVLASFLSGEFLSHIPCGLHFLIFGVSLTHPVLVSSFVIRWVSPTYPVLT